MSMHFFHAAKLGFELERLEFQRLFDKAVNGETIPSSDHLARTFQIGMEKKSFNKLEKSIFNAAHLLGEAWALGGLRANLEINKNRAGASGYSETLSEIRDRIDKLGIFRTFVSKLTERNTIQEAKAKRMSFRL